MFADVVAGVEGAADADLLDRLREVEARRRADAADEAVVLAELGRGFANPRCGGAIESVIGTMLASACRLEFDDVRLLVRRWEQRADASSEIALISRPRRVRRPGASAR